MDEQENDEYKPFKRHGIPPDLEQLMEEVFGGAVATGDHVLGPTMDPTTMLSTAEEDAEGTELSGEEGGEDSDGGGDHLSGFQVEIDHVFGPEDLIAPPGHFSNIVRGLSDVEIPLSCPSAIPGRSQIRKRAASFSPTLLNARGGKRGNGRVGGATASLYQQQLATSIEANKAMVSMLAAETGDSEASNVPESSTMAACKVVDEMIASGMLVEGTPLWCFAISTLTKESQRDMFLSLGRNSARLSWIEWEFSLKMGMLAGPNPPPSREANP